MKNITLSASEQLIETARRRALLEHTTLNQQFRLWLQEYVCSPQQSRAALETIRTLRKGLTTGGRKFSRDKMNER